jgi:50S ribosomal subunit-associated GTPase HflX
MGYTNAGKSTLFNALVKARAYAADQLFATLGYHHPATVSGRGGTFWFPCPIP